MSIIKKSMSTIDGLGLLTGLNGGISNKSTLVDAINSVHTVAQAAAAGFKFHTVANKTTSVTASVGDQVHVTDDGDGTWAVYRVTTAISATTIAASPTSVEKLMDANALWSEFTANQIDKIGTIISNISVTGSVDLDALVLAVSANSAKVSNVTTNLSSVSDATTLTIESSDGTDAILASATTTNAGVMSATDKTKLNGIEVGAQVNTVTSVAGKTGVITLTKGDVGLGNVENTALSTWVGSTAITTLGTITSGTWNGTTIGTVTQGAVTAHQAALTITESQISDLGNYQPYNANTVVDASYAHITVTSNSVSDGTSTFTGKSYTIVSESLVVDSSGQITLTGTAVGNSLLNFNTARHTTGGVTTDYNVTYSSGNTYTVDVSLDGSSVSVQYMKLV